MDQQIFLPHPEKGVAAAVADKPLERPDVEDPGEALFIKLGHLLLPDEEVVTTHLFLHAGDLLDQRPVVDKEGERGLNLTLDKGAPDKDPGGLHGIDPAVGDGPAGDDHQTEEGYLFGGNHLAPALLPVRGKIGAAAEPPAQFLQPDAFDVRHGPGEEARGFNHLRRDDPVPGAVEEAGSRKNHRLPSLGRRVEVLLLFHGNMAKIAAQDGTMDRIVEIDPSFFG